MLIQGIRSEPAIGTEMDDVNRWRVELAHQIASLYAAKPGAEAIILTGGVSRGQGDAF